jgi:hypothetical protein
MVEAYLKQLNEMKETLKNFGFAYEHSLLGSKQILDSLNRSIDIEIKYCEFYKEYNRRLETEPNFGQWILTKKEDIKTVREWDKPQGEQWTKTNGRVKTTIQFDRSGLTVKITLKFEDDCEALKFLPDYNWQKQIPTAHLTNEKSIEAKVKEFKTMADEFLSQHLYPRYEPAETNLDILKKLLCIKT